jgi:hypothetical protein
LHSSIVRALCPQPLPRGVGRAYCRRAMLRQCTICVSREKVRYFCSRIISSIIPSAKKVLVYLCLRFRHLSGWIVVVVALPEAYLSPRDEYQRHHPPAPGSAGVYWPVVWEVGGGHGNPLRDSSVERGLRLPTTGIKNARSHEP